MEQGKGEGRGGEGVRSVHARGDALRTAEVGCERALVVQALHAGRVGALDFRVVELVRDGERLRVEQPLIKRVVRLVEVAPFVGAQVRMLIIRLRVVVGGLPLLAIVLTHEPAHRG